MIIVQTQTGMQVEKKLFLKEDNEMDEKENPKRADGGRPPEDAAASAAGGGAPGQAVNGETLRKWNLLLARYKAGKAHLDRRVQDAERWWKLRSEFTREGRSDPKSGGFRSRSSWLHNVIVNKHADAMDAYPQPNILPREEGDRLTAWALTKIVPVVLRQNRFALTYDEVMWQKLKTGTGVYKVLWDASKLNGLGDISVTRRDLLCLFWEPGIRHLQDSRVLFDVEMTERDLLLEHYPQLENAKLDSVLVPARPPADDAAPPEDRVAVVDVYYKKNGRLHYCKYVGDTVLYATENDPDRAERGLYDHGLYPYVFDTLYPVEGSPAGYGYVDVCANSQMRLDLLGTALLRNAMAGATPRYFLRQDGGVNEEEFLNIENTIVHVNGNLGEDAVRALSYTGLSGNYIRVLEETVNELRETSGNTETSTGTVSGGVTAAAAIAALQEASGKGSRASIRASYEAYAEVVNLVIELIRQFYDAPRQFRITGDMGAQRFLRFTNEDMLAQPQGVFGGVDMGYRLPLYDIDIVPEKTNAYTRLSNNELALQFFGLGFFEPANADQALMTLDMMDFDGKDELMRQIAAQGGLAKQMAQWQQLALGLAQKHEPELAAGLAEQIAGTAAAAGARPKAPLSKEKREKLSAGGARKPEPKRVQEARHRAADAARPK